MQSCLYEGVIRHRRFIAPRRTFEYPIFMVYLDLAELDQVFADRLLWSTTSPNIAWFRRADHYGDAATPLDRSIRDLVQSRTARRPEGPIRLLTHLRYLGHCFNPVSFYYCMSPDGTSVDTFVAEVTNTPWNERHMYVLAARDAGPGQARSEHVFPKAFHVSPFLDMAMHYAWRFEPPGERLSVHMENRRDEARVFDASLTLARTPMTRNAMARVLLVKPLMTIRVVAAIYEQALRLWLGRAPFFSHPPPRSEEAP
jgi:DUF1365 family protein